MASTFIPPSPNWYCPGVSDASANGLYCFASKNSVVVLNVRCLFPVHKASWVVTTERVLCVVFCRSELSGDDDGPALLTVSDDRSLKVWDLRTQKVKHETSSHSAVSFADWRGNLSTSVVFGGDKGSLMIWDLVSGVVAPTHSHATHAIQVVRSHPIDPDIVAIGYKNGLIVVQELKKGSNVAFKLKGHEEEVVSLSWGRGSPLSTEALCLCSTALDRTLRVWDVKSEKCRRTLKVPIASNKKTKVNLSQKGRLWISSAWAPHVPETVVCTTISGDVCLRNVGATESDWEFLETDTSSGGHNRCVFNLSLLRTQENVYAVTTSMDRNIVFWDLVAKKSAYCIPSLGGFAYWLEFSPIACASLAVGAGDNTIKLWRTDSVPNPYNCTSFWQGIRGRVMSVAWHPKKENLVAFGTDEGKVGILDVATGQSTVSVSYHRQAAYCVCWAELPTSQDKSIRSCLLSCGDGKVRVHHLPKLDREALDLDSVYLRQSSGKTKWITVNFSHTLGLLTLANQDGLVEVYEAKSLEKLAILKAQRKPIECITWHPSQTLSSQKESEFKYWLACSSTDGNIFLYNLARLASPCPDPIRILQPTLQLSGHAAKVVSLAWCPFKDGALASASYDGTVQVWDTIKGQPIANYRGHIGRVFSVCWSPMDSDVLFSGGEDATVKSWRLSQQEHVTPPSKSAKVAEKGSSDNAVLTGKSGEEALPNQDKEMGTKEKDESITTTAPKPAKISLGGGSKKAKSGKSFFPLFSKHENKPKGCGSDDLVILADTLTAREATSGCLDAEHAHLGMYVDSIGAIGVLDAEIQQHKIELNFDHAFQMMVWKGEIGEALREAAAKRKLTDTLVALAPSVSRALWLDMCEKYALQLSSDGEHHRAALYLLAGHKTVEAVQLLLENGLVREALSIARANLPDCDPLIGEVYSAWAEKAHSVGNYEQASKCHLARGDAGMAVSTLLSRRDPQSLVASAYIAKMYGLSADAEAAFRLALRSSLVQKEWDTALRLVEEQGKSQAFATFVHLHRGLLEAVEELECVDSCTLSLPTQMGLVIWNGSEAVSAKFLAVVREAFESRGYTPLDNTYCFTELSELLGYGDHASREVLLFESRQQVLFQVAGCLTVALFSPHEWKLYVSRALDTSFTADHSLFARLCSILFCGTVTSSRFTGEISLDITPESFCLFDQLMPEGHVGRLVSFECPSTSRELWDKFEALKSNKSAKVDVGREALGLYLSVNLLECCGRLEADISKTSFIEQMCPFVMSSTLACIEHTLCRLRDVEIKELKLRLELASRKLTGAFEVQEDVTHLSELDVECKAWRDRLQELKQAASECKFPEQVKLLDQLLQLINQSDGSDETTVKIRNRLVSWKMLVLSTS